MQVKSASYELTIPEDFEAAWNIMESCRRNTQAHTLQRTRTRTPTPTLTLTLTLTLTPDPNPNLIKLEQVSLHEDRLLLEALLQLIGKAHLQPYAVAATVGPPPPTSSSYLGEGQPPLCSIPCTIPCANDADRRRRRRLHRRLQRQQCLHLGALHLHGWQLGDIRAPPNDRQAASSAWAPIEPGQCRSVGRVTVRGARQAGAASVASVRAPHRFGGGLVVVEAGRRVHGKLPPARRGGAHRSLERLRFPGERLCV